MYTDAYYWGWTVDSNNDRSSQQPGAQLNLQQPNQNPRSTVQKYRRGARVLLFFYIEKWACQHRRAGRRKKKRKTDAIAKQASKLERIGAIRDPLLANQ